ncbi:unnamed protein product [Parajaminaea phylloscopi]
MAGMSSDGFGIGFPPREGHSQHHSHGHTHSDASPSSASSLSPTSPNNLTTAGGTSSSPPLSARRDPPRKRNRAALSCVACRERKIKCNRQVPCDQCIRRGDSELCFLDPYKRGPPASQSKSTAVQAQLAAQAEQIARRDEHRTRDHFQVHPHLPQYTQQDAQQDAHSHHRHQVQAPGKHLQPTPYADTQMRRPSGQEASSQRPSQSTNTHSQAEFEAIKGRLAQLEALFNAAGRPQGDGLPYPTAPFEPSTGVQRAHSNSSASASQFPPSSSWRPTGSVASTPSADSPVAGRGAFGAYQQANQFAVSSPPAQTSSRSTAEPAPDSQSTTTAASLAFRSAHDSDTEDAAMVLEGLAMSGQGKGSKEACPNAIVDPVTTEPKVSLASFAARNRERDIMLDVSQGGTSGPSAADVIACSADKSAEGGSTAPKTLEELEELERNGVDVSPAVKVCTLLRSSTSLLRPIFGPESYLGFGMGWAFSAAEAAKDLHVKGGECPGSAQREAVFRAIIRTLPRKQLADQLVTVYGERVNFLGGNIIHMPSLRKEVEAFYALGTVERQARVINIVDPGWLAVFLLVIGLALRFYPCTPPEEWESISHLFDGRSIHLYGSAARTCLVLARYQSSQCLSVLQSILLSVLADYHAGRKANDAMLHIAISNAQNMGLHRLGDRSNQPRKGESAGVVIRREVAKRIWYQLVFKHWCSAASSGVFVIHERSFNTPLPGNYNDADLEQAPLPPPRPHTEYTEMSYSLEIIEVVKAAKLQADLVNEQWFRASVTSSSPGWTDNDGQNSGTQGGTKMTCQDVSRIDAAYRVLLDKLPPFFAIGHGEGGDSNMEIQRWLIHQTIFSSLLKLHRPALSSKPEARASCVALARSILYTQKKLRNRCTVIDRLLFNLAQSYTAAIVLLLDLLTHGQEKSPAMRLTIRSEIAEALRALHHVNESNSSTAGGIRVIEALLQEEEARNGTVNQSPSAQHNGTAKRKRGGEPARKKDLLSMAMKIARALNAETSCKSQREQVERDRQAVVYGSDAHSAPAKATQEDVEMSSAFAGMSGFSVADLERDPRSLGALSDCQQEMTKDALCRSMMDQLFFLPATQVANAYASAGLPEPAGKQTSAPSANVNGGAGDIDPALYNSLFAGAPGSSNDVRGGYFGSGMVGPNGVEANLSPPFDANMSGFDLGSFLAQYDNQSPDGSASSLPSSGASAYSSDESARSLGAGSMGTSVGSDRPVAGGDSTPAKIEPSEQILGGAMQQSPIGEAGQQPQGSHASHATDPTTASMDAFYNWILCQGVNGRLEAQLKAAQARAQQAQNQDRGGGQQQQTQAPDSLSRLFADSGSNPSPASQGIKDFLVGWQPPLGGPPQNGWASTPAGAGETAPAATTTTTTTTMTGLTPLPSGSYDLGTPSTGADLQHPAGGGGIGGAFSDPESTVPAGWLSTPNLFDIGN